MPRQWLPQAAWESCRDLVPHALVALRVPRPIRANQLLDALWWVLCFQCRAAIAACAHGPRLWPSWLPLRVLIRLLLLGLYERCDAAPGVMLLVMAALAAGGGIPGGRALCIWGICR